MLQRYPTLPESAKYVQILLQRESAQVVGQLRLTQKASAQPSAMKEYPDEPFALSQGRLFCNSCREELSVKSSSLRTHVKSAKHQAGKKKLASKEARERDIAHALAAYDEEKHLKGETLPENQQVYRVKIVTTFLRAAVPLSKLEYYMQCNEFVCTLQLLCFLLHNVRIIGRNLENNRLILEELRNRIITGFQSILYSGLSVR